MTVSQLHFSFFTIAFLFVSRTRNTMQVIEINETNLVVSKDTVLANQKLSIA